MALPLLLADEDSFLFRTGIVDQHGRPKTDAVANTTSSHSEAPFNKVQQTCNCIIECHSSVARVSRVPI